MNEWTTLFEVTGAPLSAGPVEAAVVALLLSFILGQVIAWTYSWTHAGLSYSRSFTQSLVLLTMIVSMVMLVIGDNIVTAFGLIGALAIIRFRNVLKDTRDTVFVFLALVVGMASGSGKFVTAFVGTAATVAVMIYLNMSGFGSRGRFDGHLSLVLTGDGPPDSLLDEFCRARQEMSVHHDGRDGGTEYVYQIRLRDRARADELISALRTFPGIDAVSLTLRDELAEL